MDKQDIKRKLAAIFSADVVQKEFKARNEKLPVHRKMEFRIGINLGDVIEENDRLYGDGVNIAARLEAMADSGGICISRTAYDQIEDKLPLGYEYLGEKEVKNIPKPVPAYRVLLEPKDAAPEKKRKEERDPWKEKESESWEKDEQQSISSKKRLLALILCLLFGIFGAHRFYVGKYFTAIIQLLTIGGLGIWSTIDFFIIIFGEFSDSYGEKIREWV